MAAWLALFHARQARGLARDLSLHFNATRAKPQAVKDQIRALEKEARG